MPDDHHQHITRSDMNPHKTHGYCTLCRSRCGAIFTVQNGKLTAVEPDPDHPTGGAICAKGRAAPEILDHPDRLRTPLRRRNPKGSSDPGWEEISWKEALDEIARRMDGVRQQFGPEAVAFATTTPSGSAISDSLDWILRFVWQFGSPNLIAAVEVCNFQKDYAQEFTFGQPLGVPDFARADTIILWGNNPARTWLAQAQRIAEARRRGAKVVVIDPKRAGSGEQADLWLPIRPGGDAALAMGMIRMMLQQHAFAQTFVRDWTDAAFLIDRETDSRLDADTMVDGTGFVVALNDGRLVAIDPAKSWGLPEETDLFFSGNVSDNKGRQRKVATALALLRESAEEWVLPRVAEATGISIAQLQEFYALLTTSHRIAYSHWTGFGQGLTSTQTTRAINALFALRDDVDSPGGNRWLNGLPVQPIASPDMLSPAQRAKTLGLDALPLGPPAHAFVTMRDVCASIEGDAPNRVRMLFGFGSNLLLSHPNASRTAQALQKLDFQVHCDLFMTPTAAMADIVLPVTASLEHDAMRAGFEISESAVGHVQFRPALVAPPGQARPDYEVTRSLARRLGLEGDAWHLPFAEALDQVLAPVGLSVSQLRAQPQGITVPLDQGARYYAQAGADGAPNGFKTPSRRVEFHSTLLRRHGYPAMASAHMPMRPDADFPIRATTAKSGYYTHSSLRNLASLRRRATDPAVEVSPNLAARIGVCDRDWTVVSTPHGSVSLRARIMPEMADDTAIIEFGWWQGCDAVAGAQLPVTGEGSANINAIVGDNVRDPVSGAPPLREFYCNIRQDYARSAGNWTGERAFTVTAHELLAGDVLALTLAPDDGGSLPAFLPGQHLGLAIPGGEGRRFYSLTTDGRAADAWQLAIRRSNTVAGTDSPSISNHLHEAVRIGDRLMITPPGGSFIVPVSAQRPVICIAGGIGITPFLSAFRRARTARSPAPIMLHHVVRDLESAVFLDELTDHCRASPRLSAHLWLRRGEGQPAKNIHPGATAARIAATMDDAVLAQRPLIYLCGPTGLMDEMRALMIARGIPTADIIAEVFKTEIVPPTDLKPATITLQRSGRSFVWTPDAGSLLAAAARAGVALPSGCQVGQCESCAARVVEGQFLCPVQTELGADHCLTCQSIPLEDMVLDL